MGRKGKGSMASYLIIWQDKQQIQLWDTVAMLLYITRARLELQRHSILKNWYHV